MRELDVVGVRVEMPSNAPMVLLREVGGSRYLPIWIGANEASAIANAQEGVVPLPDGGNGWQRIFHEVGIGVLPVDIEFKDGRPVQPLK